MDDIWGFNSKKAKQTHLTQAIHYPTKSFNFVTNQLITKCLNYSTCIGVHLGESSLVPKLVIRWRVSFYYLMDMNAQCSQVFWLRTKYNIYSRLVTLLSLRLSKCFVICDVESIILRKSRFIIYRCWQGFSDPASDLPATQPTIRKTWKIILDNSHGHGFCLFLVRLLNIITT